MGCSCFSLLSNCFVPNKFSIHCSNLFFEAFHLLSHLMMYLICGLKQFSIAQTILTKSPIYLTNLLETIWSRNLHCLIRPLALNNPSDLCDQCRFVCLLSSMLFLPLSKYNGFWHYTPDLLDIQHHPKTFCQLCTRHLPETIDLHFPSYFWRNV